MEPLLDPTDLVRVRLQLQGDGLVIGTRIAARREGDDHDPEQHTDDQEPPHGASLLSLAPWCVPGWFHRGTRSV